jgi:hypothetical protein
MRLELASFGVRGAAFGPRTELDAGRLRIDREALAAAVLAGAKSLTGVRIDLLHPGEPARIIHALDASAGP